MKYYKGYKNNLYLIPNDSIEKKSTINYINKKLTSDSDSINENVQLIDTQIKNNEDLNSDTYFIVKSNTIRSDIKIKHFGGKIKIIDKLIKPFFAICSNSSLKSTKHFKSQKIESKPLAIIGIILTVIGIFLIVSLTSLTAIGIGIVLTLFGGVMGIFSFKGNKNWLSIISLVIGIIGFLFLLFFIYFFIIIILAIG